MQTILYHIFSIFFYQIFFILMLTQEHVFVFRIFLLLHKLKKLCWPPQCLLFTSTKTVSTFLSQTKCCYTFDGPIENRIRAKYVAGVRGHLFVYYAMRHSLCTGWLSVDYVVSLHHIQAFILSPYFALKCVDFLKDETLTGHRNMFQCAPFSMHKLVSTI